MEKYRCTRHTCYLQIYIIFFTKFHHLHTKQVDQRKHIHYFLGKNNIPTLEEPRFLGFILSFHKLKLYIPKCNSIVHVSYSYAIFQKVA